MISKRAKNVGIKELDIFDYFIVDENLPKNKVVITNNDKNRDDSLSTMSWSVPTSGSDGDEVNDYYRKRFSLREWLINHLSKKPKKVVPKRTMTTLELFVSLSTSYKELSQLGEIAEHYNNALVQAKTLGQTALYEKLVDLLSVVTGEARLIAMGLKKYVTEKQLITFYEKVGEDKFLKLTWIKNFGRIIPDEIYKIKQNVDEKKIFDNYVILHYDPENNGEELTKKQIEDKKDPILFGVIKNSRKLYYVADWKDDYCELTLEEMFTVLGEKVLNINNKTVKTFIDKINNNE